MDKRLTFEGGEIGISSDEINLMPNSNREGVQGINEGIGEGANMIISGVNASISAGVQVIVQDGFVFLNGETLKVDAATVPRTVGADLYQFEKVTTYPADGTRNFRDGTTHDVYEVNRAVPVNVTSINSLSVEGDKMIDVLKGLIQVQSDYTQTDDTKPDYIKNKPEILNTLLQGKVNGINVGTGGTFTSVEGGITSASILDEDTAETQLKVNFLSVGTAEYQPIITLLGKNADWDQDNDVKCIVRNLTSTSFEILFKEDTGNNQNITALITLIPMTI